MSKKVLILLGPTGVGKTRASILLAETLNTQIISADSMQIYRYMDIGTAKPTAEERIRIKHHMIDIVDPWETYSTGRYIKEVKPIIDEIHKSGNVPIIVGGTGLYIKAMTRGIFSGPTADWTLREELLAMETEEKGILYNLLREIDYEIAGRISPNDKRRIIRALEVCLKSDSKMSEMQKLMTEPLQYDFVKIGLSRNRKELYSIIEKRVDEMISAGLVNEVRNVISLINEHRKRIDVIAYDTPQSAHCSSMQAIGYKEIALYLEGKISLEEAIRLIKRGTKRYTKRQLTWFKKEEGIQWIDITGIYDRREILNRLLSSLKGIL